MFADRIRTVDIVWKQFPAREMARGGWIEVPHKGDVFAIAKD